MRFAVAAALAIGLLAGCGSASGGGAGRNPSNIKSYDVIDQRGMRHTCFENTDTGAISCD